MRGGRELRLFTIPWLDGCYSMSEISLLTTPSFAASDAALTLIKDREPIIRELLGEPVTLVEYINKAEKVKPTSNADPMWYNEQHKKVLLGKAVKNDGRLRMNLVPKICFSLLIDLLPEISDQIFRTITSLGLNRINILVADYILVTKQLSDTAKKYRTRFHEQWYHFCEWNQFVGYSFSSHTEDDEEVQLKIEGWVIHDTPVTYPVWDKDGEMLYTHMKEVLMKWLSEAAALQVGHKLDNWLLNTADWVTAGSSQGVSTMVWMDDIKEWVPSRKVKAALSVSHSVEDLKQAMLHSGPIEGYTIAHKIEPAQPGRLIVGASAYQNLRLAFISSWLESGLKKTFRESTLYMDNYKRIMISEKMIRETQVSGLIKFPADYSKFDQRVLSNEVMMIFDIVEQLSSEHWNEEYYDVVLRARKLFYDVPVRYKNAVVGLANSGLPSGTRWTAMLGTLINAARTHALLRIMDQGLMSTSTTQTRLFQGDDSTVTLTRWVDVAQLAALFSSYEMGVNPSKNFVSQVSNDFLRKFYGTTGKIGLIARRLVKLCFRDPTKNEKLDVATLTRERCKSISSLKGRGADQQRLSAYLLRDLKAVTNNVPNLERWMHTPISAGGLGVHPHSSVLWFEEVVRYEDNAFQVVIAGLQKQRLNVAQARIGFNVSGAYLSSQLGAALVDRGSKEFAKWERTTKRKQLTLKQVKYIGKLPLAKDNYSLFAIALTDYTKLLHDFRLRDDLVYLPTDEHVAVLLGGRDHDRLRDILFPSCVSTFNMLVSRFDAKVVKNWTTGGLKPRTPFFPELDDEVVSYVTNNIWAYYFNKLSYSHVDIQMASVRKLELKVEGVTAMALLGLYKLDIFNQYA